MTAAILSGESQALANFAAQASPDGLLPPSLDVTTKTIGISKDGVLYFYGDTGAAPGAAVDAIGGLILDIDLVTRGEFSKFKPREYLNIRIQSPTPLLHYLLRLPAKPNLNEATGEMQHPWSIRSLLGALTALDLQASAVKIEAKRGREATFIQVSLDPVGEQRVIEPSIGPSRQDLEEAIDTCRRSLGLEPLFI